ncbi:MAG: phosphate ABC transporter substrate-binding protein PstS [Aggregatilineales bacterium]
MRNFKTFTLGAAAIAAAAMIAFGGVGSAATAAQATMAATMAGTAATCMTAAAAAPTMAATMAAVSGSGKITGPMDGEAKQLNGAGSTFAAVLYSKWFSDYAALTGVQVNYQSIGSGGGIKSISDGTVDFGATDGPMTDDQLKAAKGGPIFHIPTALGGVVATYNIPEVKDQLKFTPDTLAGIYLGTITKWNDPKLVADNPGLANVNQPISVVHRSDGSGTTNIWTSYLSAVNPTWAKTIGAANSVNWPVGIGGKGSEGVAGDVKQTPYSVGYVEVSYATQNNLPVGLVKNLCGNYISATVTSVSLAANVPLPADMRVSVVNSGDPNAYPIAGFTWILLYQNQTDAAKATAITRAFWWALHDGETLIATDPGLNGYAPLPPAAISKAEAMLKAVTINGKPALPAGIAN